MDRRSWTLVFVIGAIWGVSFLFIEIGIRDMSSSVVAWARVALGAIVLVPVAWFRGELRVEGASVRLIVLLSAFQVAIPFVVTYLSPAFAIVYGAVLLDESIGVATI